MDRGKNPPVPPAPALTPEEDKFKKTLKAVLPYLSPENRRTMAGEYGFSVPKVSSIPSEITGKIRNVYLGRSRAVGALSSLKAAQRASGAELGPGYTFLVRAVTLLKQFGGASRISGMSRESYTRLSTALDGLLQQSKGKSELAKYAGLAKWRSQVYIGQ